MSAIDYLACRALYHSIPMEEIYKLEHSLPNGASEQVFEVFCQKYSKATLDRDENTASCYSAFKGLYQLLRPERIERKVILRINTYFHEHVKTLAGCNESEVWLYAKALDLVSKEKISIKEERLKLELAVEVYRFDPDPTLHVQPLSLLAFCLNPLICPKEISHDKVLATLKSELKSPDLGPLTNAILDRYGTLAKFEAEDPIEAEKSARATLLALMHQNRFDKVAIHAVNDWHKHSGDMLYGCLTDLHEFAVMSKVEEVIKGERINDPLMPHAPVISTLEKLYPGFGEFLYKTWWYSGPGDLSQKGVDFFIIEVYNSLASVSGNVDVERLYNSTIRLCQLHFLIYPTSGLMIEERICALFPEDSPSKLLQDPRVFLQLASNPSSQFE